MWLKLTEKGRDLARRLRANDEALIALGARYRDDMSPTERGDWARAVSENYHEFARLEAELSAAVPED